MAGFEVELRSSVSGAVYNIGAPAEEWVAFKGEDVISLGVTWDAAEADGGKSAATNEARRRCLLDGLYRMTHVLQAGALKLDRNHVVRITDGEVFIWSQSGMVVEPMKMLDITPCDLTGRAKPWGTHGNRG